MNEKNKKIILIVVLSIIVISAFIYYLYYKNNKEESVEDFYAKVVSGKIEKIENNIVYFKDYDCSDTICQLDNNIKEYKITKKTKFYEDKVYLFTGEIEAKEITLNEIKMEQDTKIILEKKNSKNIKELIINISEE